MQRLQLPLNLIISCKKAGLRVPAERTISQKGDAEWRTQSSYRGRMREALHLESG